MKSGTFNTGLSSPLHESGIRNNIRRNEMSTEMIEKPEKVWILRKQADSGSDPYFFVCGVTFDAEIAEGWKEDETCRHPYRSGGGVIVTECEVTYK
jgi:hypothetical protein